MKLTIGLSATYLLLLSTLGVLAAPRKQDAIAAVYFMTNDIRGNSVVVHDVLPDGTVKYARSYSTGGIGAVTIRDPPAPDALRTQGSVAVSGNRLYNTNAGSNTVSMFEINSNQPDRIKMIGKPVDSGGEFPASVTVSNKTGNVCVLNGGNVNGVQCFRSTARGLVKIPGSNRLLNLPQTTPATKNDTLYSFSTILFSRYENKLVIDVKGLVQQNVPGFLAIWDVMPDGSLSEDHQIFPAPSSVGAQNFGMTLLDGKDGFVVTDITVGGIVYDFSNGYGPEAIIKNFEVPGQETVCWINYASKSDTYFLTDSEDQVIFEVAVDNETYNSTTINQFQLPMSTFNVDTAVGTLGNNQYLYQLASRGASIFVFDIQPAGGTKLIQSYNYTEGLINDRVDFAAIGPDGLAFFVKE